MAGLKKLGAIYLIGVAVAVAVFFVVNSSLADSIEVLDVWYVLDVLMFIGLAISLPYNYARKRRECDGARAVASPAATWMQTLPTTSRWA